MMFILRWTKDGKEEEEEDNHIVKIFIFKIPMLLKSR